MKSGIYGLFGLDGTPVEPRDARALGLAEPAGSEPAIAQAIDAHAPGALHRADDAQGLTVLAGHLYEPEALAARLTLARDIPAALLARAALLRFGGSTPDEMIGEWSLLHWDRSGRLTLMLSAARRDRLFFAVSGTRVAVASDLFCMSTIPWIGNALDDAGLLFAVGRESVRGAIGDRTMLERVRELEPGTCVTITTGEIRKETAAVLIPQPRWTGSFGDAVAEAEELLRRIMRTRLARTAVPAALLSGGLDSSTTSWLAAEERATGQRLLLITSVAPPGSGLADEAAFADAVAERLGLRSEHVSPPDAADIYRPTDAILSGASRPPLSNRHYLTDMFQTTARQLGATTLIDGMFGEMTLTNPVPLTTVSRQLRGVASRIRRGWGTSPAHVGTGDFHVRLAPHLLAALPEAVRAAAAAPLPPKRNYIRRAGDVWGYMPGVSKMLLQPNEFYPGALRMELPFRDMRLLRLFAGFPARFLEQDGVDRAVGRHMLAGHLPDSIRLRRTGMPASPDHYARLKRHAPAARSRIAAFRNADVQAWLDLDWLDQALARVAEHGAASVADANEVQLTAITAEFLCWWRAR